MKKITKIEIIMSVDEDSDLYSRDIFLNGEKVFHDEFKKNLLNTKDFIHEFANKLITRLRNTIVIVLLRAWISRGWKTLKRGWQRR